jgi:hypothetical protein
LTNVYFGTNAGYTTKNANYSGFITNASGKIAQVYFYAQQDNDLTNRTIPTFAYGLQGILIPYNTGYQIGMTRWSDVITTPVAPLISGGPANQTNLVGTTASFSASVAGYTNLSYQWLFNGNPLSDNGRIAGSTTNALSIANIDPSDAGTYTLQVSNWVGIATAAATLTVTSPLTPVTSITAVQSGSNLQITYSGGSAAHFVLVGTDDLTVPVANWPIIATTNGTTPATFTIPVSSSGNQFFRIKSQ